MSANVPGDTISAVPEGANVQDQDARLWLTLIAKAVNFILQGNVTKLKALFISITGLTGTEPTTTTGSFSGWPKNRIFVSESMTEAASGGGHGIIGLEVDLDNAGGATTNGTHIALVSEAVQRNAISSGASVSIQGHFAVGASLASQGGIPGGAGARGQVWGISTIGGIYPGATGFVSVNGAECDVYVQEAVNIRFGVNAVDYFSTHQGSNQDAAFAVTASPSSTGWKTAFGVSDDGGGVPLSANGYVLKYTGSGTVPCVSVLDLTGFAPTMYQIAGSGVFNVDLNSNGTLANLTLTGGFLNGPSGLIIQNNSTAVEKIGAGITIQGAAGADPTGGDKGVGTLNVATGFYVNGSKGATYQAQPANPTGTTSTTGVMMGLAGSITPKTTGTVVVIVSGTGLNNTNGDGFKVQIRFGTGSAPTNAAALTGSLAGAEQGVILPTANDGVIFSCNALGTGLSIGTAYWIDVHLKAVTGGTASIQGVSITAFELTV